MSSKPPEKPENPEIDEASPDPELNPEELLEPQSEEDDDWDQDGQALDDDDEDETEEDGDEDEDEVEVDDEEDEDEFTLDQLSEAYSRVVKGAEDEAADDAVDGSMSDEPAEHLQHGSTSAATADAPDNRPAASELAVLADEADNAPCPISPESIIESILFVGTPQDVKLNSRKIAAVLRDVSPQEVTKIVKQLNAIYESENAAYRIKSEKGGLKMVLDDKLHEFQQEFYGRNKQVRLSQTAIDVMAVVAYNQPASREQVDKARLKPSGSILNQLVKRKLIYIVPNETSDKVKRYATTDKFLDFFHLEDIADLPQSSEDAAIEELVD